MSQWARDHYVNGIPQTNFRRRISSFVYSHDVLRFTGVAREAHPLEGINLICIEPPVLCIWVPSTVRFYTANSRRWRRIRPATAFRLADRQTLAEQQVTPSILRHPPINTGPLRDPVVERHP